MPKFTATINTLNTLHTYAQAIPHLFLFVFVFAEIHSAIFTNFSMHRAIVVNFSLPKFLTMQKCLPGRGSWIVYECFFFRSSAHKSNAIYINLLKFVIKTDNETLFHYYLFILLINRDWVEYICGCVCGFVPVFRKICQRNYGHNINALDTLDTMSKLSANAVSTPHSIHSSSFVPFGIYGLKPRAHLFYTIPPSTRWIHRYDMVVYTIQHIHLS